MHLCALILSVTLQKPWKLCPPLSLGGGQRGACYCSHGVTFSLLQIESTLLIPRFRVET